MTTQDFKAIKTAVDLASHVASETGLPIKKVGTDTVNLSQCPFCRGHDCFRINTEKQFWKCFQCDSKGDIFRFTELFKNLSKADSLHYLAQKYGIQVTENISTQKSVDTIQIIKDDAFMLLKSHSNKNFTNKIIFNEEPISLLHYLKTIRKHDQNTINSFGVVPSHKGLAELLINKGHVWEDIEKAGFSNSAQKDYFPENILLYPVFIGGKLSHFCAKDPLGKVKYQAKKKHRNPDALFFNMDSFEAGGNCMLVEGCNDVISIRSKGGHKFVVATLGQLTEKHRKWLVKTVQDKRITLYLCFDNDNTGEIYTNKIISDMKSHSLLSSVRLMVFDGAKDIDEYLGNSKDPKNDFKNLMAYAQRPPQKVYNVTRKKDGYYRVKCEKNNEPDLSAISNFTLSIINEIHTEDDCLRELCLTDQSGKKSHPTTFTSKDLSSPQDFTHKLLKIGAYGFWGNSKDLKETLLLEMSKYSGRRVHLINHVGYSETYGFWIFQNGIVKNQKFIPSDSQNVTWLTSETGYKIQPLDELDGAKWLPTISQVGTEEAKQTLDEFLDTIRLNLGGYEGWLAFGFVIASVHAPEIVRAYGYFPFLFLIGKHQSGKNVLASLLLSCQGISESEIESLPSARSPVGIMRKLGYFSNCFVWLDEYRGYSHQFDGILRNAYNRVARTTGIKGNFGTRRNPIRAVIGLSGEHLPQDPATRSRCVFVRLSSLKRRDDFYPKLQELAPHLSGIFYQLLIQKTDQATKTLLEDIQSFKKSFIDEGIPAREAGNYAIPVAAIWSVKPDSDFITWVLNELIEHNSQSNENSIAEKFLEDLYHLQIKHHVNNEYVRVQRPFIFLWLRGIHSLWIEVQQRSGQELIPYDALLNLFKEEPYFNSYNKPKRMGAKNTPRKCLILHLNGDSDILKAIAEQSEESFSKGFSAND